MNIEITKTIVRLKRRIDEQHDAPPLRTLMCKRARLAEPPVYRLIESTSSAQPSAGMLHGEHNRVRIACAAAIDGNDTKRLRIDNVVDMVDMCAPASTDVTGTFQFDDSIFVTADKVVTDYAPISGITCNGVALKRVQPVGEYVYDWYERVSGGVSLVDEQQLLVGYYTDDVPIVTSADDSEHEPYDDDDEDSNAEDNWRNDYPEDEIGDDAIDSDYECAHRHAVNLNSDDDSSDRADQPYLNAQLAAELDNLRLASTTRYGSASRIHADSDDDD